MRALIKRIRAQHPEVRAVEFNLAAPANVEKMAGAYQRYGVPEEQWGGTIALFAGDQWWNDGDKILRELSGALEGMLQSPERWTPPEPSTANGRMSEAAAVPVADGTGLRRVFNRFGVAAVAVAGLVDGINPCALATLVFLISYLAYSKRSSREILATGILFAAGVFLAYLAVGLGLFRALQLTAGLPIVSRLLYPTMSLGTLVLAGYSARDYWLARRGAHREMTLQLPASIKRLSHGTIRNLGRPGVFLGTAFVVGAAVSVLELFCTGQIYLPTLMYVWSTGSAPGRTLGLLLLYVAMFTLPVCGVTVLAYAGMQSKTMAALTRRHLATVRLATAALFLLLAALLAAVSVGKL